MIHLVHYHFEPRSGEKSPPSNEISPRFARLMTCVVG